MSKNGRHLIRESGNQTNIIILPFFPVLLHHSSPPHPTTTTTPLHQPLSPCPRQSATEQSSIVNVFYGFTQHFEQTFIAFPGWDGPRENFFFVNNKSDLDRNVTPTTIVVLSSITWQGMHWTTHRYVLLLFHRQRALAGAGGVNRMGHKLMGNLRQTIEAVGVFGGGRKKLSPIHTPSSSFLIADELSDYVEGTVHY